MNAPVSSSLVFRTSARVVPQSFADILRRSMDASRWATLHPAIRRRFSPMLRENMALSFSGTMQWVYCSPIGALLARVLRPFSILPDTCQQHTDFDFKIFRRGDVIMKQRRYRLRDNDTFTFTSKFSGQPHLHEEFGGGIGMYLQLDETQSALMFKDNGYFLRLGQWRIRLPRWLTVGSFELLHRNIDAQRFQVIIRVAHPLFGTLFYQRGEFFNQSG
ncbi:DUF4166 domain-containing protein [Kaarinaea lacus]